MTRKLFILLLVFRIVFVNADLSLRACDLSGHFDFEVSNEEEVLYYGCYDAINKGPHIIMYILTNERLVSKSVRRPSVPFTQDRDGGVLWALLQENGYDLPHHSDYTHSGYDRGHMAPNADFNNTRENALATFFIANIWPQTPEVNRDTWLKTENETRRLAVEYMFIKVIIIVDEFSDKTVKDISVPLVFKRRVYDLYSEELIYEADVYQESTTPP
jgi:DNA/RNA endonuclease G (NUC1)